MQILALDDEPGALKVLVRAIQRACADASVESFLNVNDALEFAQTHTVDVAFIDIQMPEMTGIEIAERLSETNPLVNIIFATGYSNFAMDAMKMHASGYLMKPITASDVAVELSHLRNPVSSETVEPLLQVQTFGNFEVFCKGQPVVFKRSKSKEMLAYLIDRQGSSVNKKEIAAVMFGDDYSSQVQNYISKIYKDLADALEAVGAGNVLAKSFNAYAVDASKIDCDLYRYLDGDETARALYTGEYMFQYSWAEDRYFG